MKINIRGNDITPDKIASALASCEQQHGLKIKGATIYVRFENEMGQTVEPLKNGEEFSRDFAFWKPKQKNCPLPKQEPPSVAEEPIPIEAISSREMIEICMEKAHRSLSKSEMTILMDLANTKKVSRNTFVVCVEQTMSNGGRFNASHLKSLIHYRL